MPGLDARGVAIAGCVLLSACFKLNPDFVDEVPTGTTAQDTGTATSGSGSTTAGADARVTDGLRVLYGFEDQACQTPGVVEPLVGVRPLALDPGCARCEGSALVIDAGCEPPMLTDGAEDLGTGAAFTLEAWVSPTTEEEANLLGQAGKFSLTADATRQVSLRPDLTNTSGPPLVLGTAGRRDGQPWHLAVTYDGSWLRVFIDQEQVEQSQSGAIQWSGGPGPLQFGGSTNRVWLGSVHLLAVYDRALSYAEYCQNHAASPWSDGGC